jgi:hypothetical protein
LQQILFLLYPRKNDKNKKRTTAAETAANTAANTAAKTAWTQPMSVSVSLSTSASLPAALQTSRALETVVRFLLPYFCVDCPDFATTRAEIIETLASYGPRNRAELFAAAQVVACTMSALATMAEAEGSETMSPSMRLRFRGCANTITRHGQQAQQILDKRLACDLPIAVDPAAEAAKDAEVIEQVRQVQLKVEAAKRRLAETDPEAARRLFPDQQDLDQLPWGSAMLAAVANAAMPPGGPAGAASAA